MVMIPGCCFSRSGRVGCGTPPGEAEGCVPKSAAVRAGASSTGHFPSLSVASSECVLILPGFHIKSPGLLPKSHPWALPQPKIRSLCSAGGRCTWVWRRCQRVAAAPGCAWHLQGGFLPGCSLPRARTRAPAASINQILASGWVRGLLCLFSGLGCSHGTDFSSSLRAGGSSPGAA